MGRFLDPHSFPPNLKKLTYNESQLENDTNETGKAPKVKDFQMELLYNVDRRIMFPIWNNIDWSS